ncbi:alpha/beta hydrolase [Nocardia neocaledoniensis]|uniref:alpha/beta hydrolase n=1 Tax=Nocardia neocaledoniensis TaxID=236511 RepID=UPI00245642B3|nr:alpha/beta hydrolase family protein [Nocardia neocaledoniensis]
MAIDLPRAAVLAAAAVLGFCGGVASAAPAIPVDAPIPVRAMATARPAENGSRLVTAREGLGRLVDITVHSQAMGRAIDVEVLPAADSSRPAPVLYLLNGVDGGTDTGRYTDGSNWLTKTDVEQFLADEQVTVVMPVGGGASFYTDWLADDPRLGRHRWTTFLTEELPPVIDSAFHGTGANAVAGLSMASAAVFQLAIEAPGTFRAVAAYSGCVRTSDPAGQALVDAVVIGRQGNPLNMWGPPTDPRWSANDPYLRAAELRGTEVYVATGNGWPGSLDTLDGPGIHHNPVKLADQLLIGGVLDAVANLCALQLRDRLRELAIPATFDLRPSGTHSWGYWEQDLHRSWPTLEAALNR